MNRHQVLTGACNFGEKCHAVGSVEGIHFTVSNFDSSLLVLVLFHKMNVTNKLDAHKFKEVVL